MDVITTAIGCSLESDVLVHEPDFLATSRISWIPFTNMD